MKKFVMGFLTCLILSISSIALAASYTAVTASFPVFINGVKFESDKPILAIDGSTYLPLKAIGDALGVNVVWNNDIACVDITSAKLLEEEFTLSQGQYIVGEDIKAGKYNCTAISGCGNFVGDVRALGLLGLNTILSAENSNSFYNDMETYTNLRLQNGDTLQITSNLKIKFTKIN